MSETNLSSALEQSASNPSVFEVIAQENLNELFRPACRHLIEVLARSQPEYFGSILRSFDAIYNLVVSSLQFYFITNHSASLAEYYYDLKRSEVTFKQRLLQVSALVLLPYLQNKLQTFYETSQQRTDSNKFLPQLYTLSITLYNFSQLYYTFMFAVGKSHFHSSIQRLLGIKLRRKHPSEAT